MKKRKLDQITAPTTEDKETPESGSTSRKKLKRNDEKSSKSEEEENKEEEDDDEMSGTCSPQKFSIIKHYKSVSEQVGNI